MNGDDEVIWQREAAAQRLKEALADCERSILTTNEILAVVRRHVLGEDGVLIVGELLDHFDDDDASALLRTIYFALSGDGVFSFGTRRTPENIMALCQGLIGADVAIDSRTDQCDVTITKRQS